MAALGVALFALPSMAQAATGTGVFTCSFTGSATTSPPVQLVGGSGSYSFSGPGSCNISDATDAAENANNQTITISSTGTYTNAVCGTGTADGSASITGSNAEFPASVTYHIDFTAGGQPNQQDLTITGGSHADGSGGTGSGSVQLGPPADTSKIGPPPNCTSAFSVSGNATINATDTLSGT